jgi:integrase/recombinase XerD
MASIKLILRVDKVGKTNEAPLYLRLIKDRKTKFISLGIKLTPNEWDEDKQRVKKNHSNSARINALLAQKVAEAEGQIADMSRKKAQPSAKKLKEAIKGKDATNFFEYSYARCEKMKNTLSPATYRNYTKYLSKFEKFMGTTEIFFEDINVTTLKDYANHCSKNLNNNNTTIHYSLTILSIMFKDAQREDVIPYNLYPFDKFRVKKEKSKRNYLSKEQLDELIALDVPQTGKAQVCKDMFLFSVFGGGLRFGDISELQWKHYSNEDKRITKVIRKTGRQHSFKLGSVAIEILEKYKTDNSQPEDFIFPLLEYNELYFKDNFFRTRETERHNALCNFHLNNFGKALKLPFSLSFHLSRHTFATRALNNGMRIEHVSKLMDHSGIGITQIYAKIINEELDKAVDEYIN